LKRLTGLIAAAFSPMNEDGSLALDRVGGIVDHLHGQGISAVFLCGSTGEGESLARGEREEVATAYVEAVAGRLPVIVQVGHNSLREARALAEHAARIGADAIGTTPPAYFPLADPERVVDCMEEIATGAPELPLYYYHIPRLTGVALDELVLLERAEARLPSFRGIKYSEITLDRLNRAVVEYGERLDILFGSDEMLLAGIASGAHGAVGSTYNFMGRRYNAVLDALSRGDLATAQREQASATRLVHAMIRYPAMPALKATMKLAGVDCGPPRLPLRPLSEEQVGQLQEDLRRLGFFEEGGGR